jgi:hypothetical protein
MIYCAKVAAACRLALLSGVASLAVVQLSAQFAPLKTKLKAQTAADFQVYTQHVEAELNTRWTGKRPFLQLDQDSAVRADVMSGEVWIQPAVQPNPHSISDGLIHDWYGAVYMPNADLARVLGVLQDFDHHAAIYPQVTKSRLVKRNGNDITGYWRLEQKGQVLPAVFDVTQTVHYKQVAPDKWVCLSHANDIQAVEDQGSTKEKDLPPGEGIGLMWKLYSYWSLEQLPGGVLAECRTVSLSRGLPASVAWMIRPFINSIPRDSMDSTLRNTRKASGE